MARAGRVRIISGKWRHRFIPIPEGVELRPTTDRIRETLFNWIMPDLPGAVCLDVCSGSGVLAFEALSGGAERVTLIDNSRQVVQHLQEQAVRLETQQAEIVCADVVNWLSTPAKQQYNIAFVDPPFASGLWTPICQQLSQQEWLAPNALIYLEMPVHQVIELPAHWQALKQKRAGSVCYELWQAPGN